jgi:aspartyl-tRNA(Asn)/glutamyl-tRNA(Gln) amidotransferase subunit A
VRVQQFRSGLLVEFLQALEQVDVIVSPAAPWEAPAKDPVVAGDEGFMEARRTGPYNLTGLPAVSVPCGFGQESLPLGLQIAGPPMAEGLILKVAHAYEQRAGWFREHPSLE